jgi:hypothetical protein
LKDDPSEAQKCTEVFRSFITECDKLAATKKGENSPNNHASAEDEVELLANVAPEKTLNLVDQYKKAFEFFKEILNMQYVHIFRPYYDGCFKKSNLL